MLLKSKSGTLPQPSPISKFLKLKKSDNTTSMSLPLTTKDASAEEPIFVGKAPSPLQKLKMILKLLLILKVLKSLKVS